MDWKVNSNVIFFRCTSYSVNIIIKIVNCSNVVNLYWNKKWLINSAHCIKMWKMKNNISELDVSRFGKVHIPVKNPKIIIVSHYCDWRNLLKMADERVRKVVIRWQSLRSNRTDQTILDVKGESRLNLPDEIFAFAFTSWVGWNPNRENVARSNNFV